MKNSLLIIDGLNYLFRAYFGISNTAKTKSGIRINAVYGFFAFLRQAVKTVTPHYLIVIFDSENAVKSKQQRFEKYKANRSYEDTGMFAQLRIIKSILGLMKIKYLEEDYIEADDLIGTYCKMGREQQCMVYVSSNDLDFIQLISEDIFVIRNYRGEQHILTEEKVKDRFGILPSEYPDYVALLGDKSDNIAGIKSVGKKTAQEIIKKFNSIENLINNTDALPDRLKIKIKENIHKILINKEMITINPSVINNPVALNNFKFIKDGLNLKTARYLNELKI